MLNKSKYPTRVQRKGYEVELANPFDYTVNFAALAFGANPVTQPFTVQNDADFLWCATSYIADIAGAALTLNTLVVPLVNVTFFLVSEPFQDSETPLAGVAGSADTIPIELNVPFWIPGGSTFKVQARNYSAATTYDLWIAFHGLKYKKI